jgi:Na+/alanine symporter
VIVFTIAGLVILITWENSLFTGLQTLERTTPTSYVFGRGLGMVSIGKYVADLSMIPCAFTAVIAWNDSGENVPKIFSEVRPWLPRDSSQIFRCLKSRVKINADIAISLMAISNPTELRGLKRKIIGERKAFFPKSKRENVRADSIGN